MNESDRELITICKDETPQAIRSKNVMSLTFDSLIHSHEHHICLLIYFPHPSKFFFIVQLSTFLIETVF